MYVSMPTTAPAVRSLVVVEDATVAEKGFRALFGDDGGVALTTQEDLSADWPDYVVARARTSGALIAEAPSDAEGFTELAEGRLFGRLAVAGLVSGALVFLTGDAAAAPLSAPARNVVEMPLAA
ncbi:MAG: hypothetical protein AAFW88_03030 [Pseudomonadota bacterium]